VGVGVRSRRWAAIGVLVAAAALLVSPADEAPPRLHPFGTATPGGTPAGDAARRSADVERPAPAHPVRVDPSPRPARTVGEAFGAYVGDADDLALVTRFETALGLPRGQTLGAVLRYANGTERGSWQDWRDSIDEILAVYAAPGQTRRLVLAVPLLVDQPLPAGSAGLVAAGLRRDPRTSAAGAAGAYDEQWRWLGERLADSFGRRLGRSVLLRPGWEANGDWYRWGYGTGRGYDAGRAADFAAYWRRVHDLVMGPVEAAGASLPWVLNASASAYRTGGFEAAWPGDRYVDVASLDVYQNFDFRSTSDFTAAGAALAWLEAVGAARGTLVGLDETSVSWRRHGGEQVGGGDNTLWFSSLRRWADRLVAERRLSHILVFDADPGPTDLFAPVFPRHPDVYAFPQARADLIANFGGGAR
jgi:hypothetical protein